MPTEGRIGGKGMSFEDDMFNIFLLLGYICLLPFSIAAGTIAYPILVAIWINEYIENRR